MKQSYLSQSREFSWTSSICSLRVNLAFTLSVAVTCAPATDCDLESACVTMSHLQRLKKKTRSVTCPRSSCFFNIAAPAFYAAAASIMVYIGARCEPCFTISSAKRSSNQLQGTVDMIRDVTSDVSLHLFPAHRVQARYPLNFSWVPAFVVELVLAFEVPPALATCHRGTPRAISKYWASLSGPEAEYRLELVLVPECMASNVCTRTNTQS